MEPICLLRPTTYNLEEIVCLPTIGCEEARSLTSSTTSRACSPPFHKMISIRWIVVIELALFKTSFEKNWSRTANSITTVDNLTQNVSSASPSSALCQLLFLYGGQIDLMSMMSSVDKFKFCVLIPNQPLQFLYNLTSLFSNS